MEFIVNSQPNLCSFILKTYQANATNAGVDNRTLWGIGRFLSEEEIELVIIPLCAVWNELCMDKRWVCKK